MPYDRYNRESCLAAIHTVAYCYNVTAMPKIVNNRYTTITTVFFKPGLRPTTSQTWPDIQSFRAVIDFAFLTLLYPFGSHWQVELS